MSFEDELKELSWDREKQYQAALDSAVQEGPSTSWAEHTWSDCRLREDNQDGEIRFECPISKVYLEDFFSATFHYPSCAVLV